MVKREDASGSDLQMSVGWGEENDTRAKRFTFLGILDRKRAREPEDMSQHARLPWFPVLHNGDGGIEFGWQRRQDMFECRDSPRRCADDDYFEHRIGAHVGGRRWIFDVVLHLQIQDTAADDADHELV